MTERKARRPSHVDCALSEDGTANGTVTWDYSGGSCQVNCKRARNWGRHPAGSGQMAGTGPGRLRIPMMVMGDSDLIVMVVSERNDHHDRSEATLTL